MHETMRALSLQSRRALARDSGRKHKAWGGARLCERNPKIELLKAREPMKWATAFVVFTAVARFTGSDIMFRDPGVALAEPRSTPGFMLTPAIAG